MIITRFEIGSLEFNQAHKLRMQPTKEKSRNLIFVSLCVFKSQMTTM